ncbi:hypothetical protein M0802_015170 [Mischocyttarus mexicanus]|nr:hypothetical protein M0802_015170 [Mischocyttarus mexicanus]
MSVIEFKDNWYKSASWNKVVRQPVNLKTFDSVKSMDISLSHILDQDMQTFRPPPWQIATGSSRPTTPNSRKRPRAEDDNIN